MKFKVQVNGTNYEVEIKKNGDASVTEPTRLEAPKVESVATTEGTQVISPMPGNIMGINVVAGDSVSEGDVLLTIEAMKMENEIPAAVSGKVASIQISKGAVVNTGDVLMVIV